MNLSSFFFFFFFTHRGKKIRLMVKRVIEVKKKKKKAEMRHDVTFVSGELVLRVPWRSNTFYAPFYFHHI